MSAPVVSLWTVDAAAETVTMAACSDERLAESLALMTDGFGRGAVGWVARHRQALDVPDVRADSRFPALDRWAAHKLTSFFALPMMSGGSILGVLAFNGGTPFRFGREDRDLLDVFVAQAVAAIRNARVVAESEARRRGAEALGEVSRALSQTLDLQVVGHRITESVRRLLGVLSAAVYQREPGTEAMVLVAESRGSEATFPWTRTLAAGEGMAGLAARERRTVTASDALADPRLVYPPEGRARLLQSAYRALMAVPLLAQDRVIGALVVVHLVGRAFTSDEVALAQAFADQAAVALENARLYEEAEQRRREAEALARMARTLTESLDIQDVGTRITESVRDLFGASLSRLRLIQPDGSFRAIAWSGAVSDHSAPDHPLPPGTGVSAVIAREGRPFRSLDVLNDPSVVASEETRSVLQASGARAFLGAPLRVQGRIIGSLTVGDQLGRVFTEADASLLEAFAHQAAIALENARLYADAERRLRETELLAELSRSVTESLDLDIVLPRVVHAVRELCRSDLARVALPHPASGAMTLRYWVGAMPEEWLSTPLEPGKGLGGQVLITGRPMRTDDYANDPRISGDYLRLAGPEGIATGLCVPMVSRGQIEGLLFALNTTARPFTDHDEAVLMRLGSLASSAIMNAQLFAREREARGAAEVSEHALRESESRYRGLVEGSIQGIYIHQDSVIQFANAALARIFGYVSAEEMVGAPTTGLVAPHEASRLAGYAAARLRGEPVPARYEYEGVRKDGTRIWVEAAASLVPWEGGKAFLITVVDITERKRLEEELRQAQKMEAVGRLAGGVAHDFNNLLTVILGRSHLILRRLGPEDPLRREIELIERTGERASSVTQQLLAFSRKQVLQPKALDLNTVVRGMEMMLQRLIGEHIRLAVVLGEELWRVKADPGQLEQVILNLALNARDAMSNGGTLTIATANVTLHEDWVEGHPGSRPGRHVRLAVIDTGIGMDEKTRSQVFDPFFTTKDVGKGTGLGLAVVYGIIKQSDGHIAVASAPERGTSFEIYLPALAVAAAASERMSGDEEIARGRETVLLVEDEVDVRALARDILRMAGYQVLEAVSVTDAERLCREHAGPIHLLLTDVIMPRMSGRGLAVRLAGLRPSLRVLYMSGYTDDAIGRHGILDPGIAYLPKPFTPAALAGKVREVLDRTDV